MAHPSRPADAAPAGRAVPAGRGAEAAPLEYRFGPFLLSPGRRALLQAGEPVRLGSRAMDILVALVEQAGEIVGKDALMRRVWPSAVVEEGALRVHMTALRKALGEGQSGARFITNVPMRGYCLVVPVVRLAARPETQGPALQDCAREPSPLPAPLTRVIGRGEAIAAVCAALAERRLVTLVGPGGMGKTTVALAAADRLRAQQADGVRFVDLGALGDGSLIPSALATALGVPLRTEDPLRDLLAWLADRRLLVVLDNCEHLVADAARFVETLLAGARQVQVLATSREPLRARGEWVQRLGSLQAPPPDEALDYAQSLAYPAFELFVERAAASLDGISFGDADAAAITSACRRLDGMPLAIELVAAQVGFFGLAGLLEKLDDHLSLPTLGLRTALPRHQTLRATLEWSHQLLSAPEQRVLRRLSVFRDRFSLQAAERVAQSDEHSVARAVMGLVHKSLVVADASDDGVHYRLLETTRSYARERLQADDDHADIGRRHCLYCLAAVATAAVELDTLLPRRWRDRHGRLVDDMRAALAWAFGAHGDAHLGARLVAESPALWFGLWLVKEYQGRLALALQRLPPQDSGGTLEMQLSLEFAQATVALRGGAPEAVQALERSLEIARALASPGDELRALWVRYGTRLLRGEYASALEDTDAYGLAAQRAADPQLAYIHHRMRAVCLHFLGLQEPAQQHAEQALHPSAEAVRYTRGNGYQFEHRPASLTHLARILWLRGRPDEAMRLAQEAVEAAKAVDHALSLAYALAFAACPVALWCGNAVAASAYVEELDECSREHGLVFWQSWPRVYRAAMQVQAGAPLPFDPEQAGLQAGQLDVLATLHVDLVGPTVLRRAADDLVRWCAPEVRRAQALRGLAAGELSRGQAAGMLSAAIALAASQGALAWELRSRTTALELKLCTDAARARAELAELLGRMQGGTGTADVRRARALVGPLAAR